MQGSYSMYPKIGVQTTETVDVENIQSSQTAIHQGYQIPSAIPSSAEANSTPDIETTLSPVPLLSEPLPTITQTIIPPSTSDLLFLSQRQLLRWDHVTDFVGALAEGVIDFSVSADGRTIAMLRSRDITTNGEEKYGLDLLDFETKQIRTLLEQSPLLYYMKISPDAQWISFFDQENPGRFLGIRIDDFINMATSESSSIEPIEIGQCDSDAGAITDTAWSPDSQSLLWSDSNGIWLSTPSLGTAQQIQPAQVTVTNPQDQTSEIEVFFHSLKWSPAGRFAMVTVTPRSSNISWIDVIDTRTGKLAQVPDSFEVNEWETSVSWMKNGDILVLHTSDPLTHSPIFVKVFRTFYTNPELLVETKLIEFPGDLFQDESILGTSESGYYLDWANQLDDRMLLLGAANTTDSIPPTLYRLDLDFNKFERVFKLPDKTMEILWSPDGQNALILRMNEHILLLSIKGGTIRDLSSILPEDAHDFIWLPPFPRS